MNVEYQKNQNTKQHAARLIRHLLLAWLTAAAAQWLLLPGQQKSLEGLQSLASMSFPGLLLVTGIVLVLLEGVFYWRKRDAARWMLLAAFTVLSAAALAASFTWPLLAACVLLFGMLFVYALRGWDSSPMPEKSRAEALPAVGLTAILAVGFFLLVSVWTVGRVRSFCAPTYDFGIFAQMFHSMKTTGLPITTVERDGALSHFAVHVSPIYYLLLPFYMVVPKPETLQVLQAAVLASAVIPLYKIGKRYGLPPFARTALCALLLLRHRL